jgi:hypothetical protein
MTGTLHIWATMTPAQKGPARTLTQVGPSPVSFYHNSLSASATVFTTICNSVCFLCFLSWEPMAHHLTISLPIPQVPDFLIFPFHSCISTMTVDQMRCLPVLLQHLIQRTKLWGVEEQLTYNDLWPLLGQSYQEAPSISLVASLPQFIIPSYF